MKERTGKEENYLVMSDRLRWNDGNSIRRLSAPRQMGDRNRIESEYQEQGRENEAVDARDRVMRQLVYQRPTDSSVPSYGMFSPATDGTYRQVLPIEQNGEWQQGMDRMVAAIRSDDHRDGHVLSNDLEPSRKYDVWEFDDILDTFSRGIAASRQQGLLEGSNLNNPSYEARMKKYMEVYLYAHADYIPGTSVPLLLESIQKNAEEWRGYTPGRKRRVKEIVEYTVSRMEEYRQRSSNSHSE